MSAPEISPADDDAAPARSVVAAISNEMVRLYKEKVGRGPTRARTHPAGPDIVVAVPEDSFAAVERTLADPGEHTRLRDTRLYPQYASVRDFCEPVERPTGRRVRSFHSSVDTLVDGMAIATFVLHPEGAPAPSRADVPL